MKTGHLGHIFDLFEGNVVCGDDDTTGAMRGKPQPDIFLVAASQKLGRDVGPILGVSETIDLSPQQLEERARGLVFEDGLPGMQAGKRAGMNGMTISSPFPAVL